MPSPEITQIKNLVKQSNLKGAVNLLLAVTNSNPDWNNIAIAQSARLSEITKKENMGVISFENATLSRNQVAAAIIDLLNSVEEEQFAEKKTVFISYNHNDTAIAQKLKSRLIADGIKVTIDSDAMGAGENIKEFIEKAVRETETTLSIVSVNSLLSAWVAMETLDTMGLRLGKEVKKFIPCYTEPDFFDPGFTDTSTKKLNEKISSLAVIIENRVKQGQDSLDVNDEYSRLIKLRNSLAEIVGHLRNSLCIDISDVNFEAGIFKIIQKIKE